MSAVRLRPSRDAIPLPRMWYDHWQVSHDFNLTHHPGFLCTSALSPVKICGRDHVNDRVSGRFSEGRLMRYGGFLVFGLGLFLLAASAGAAAPVSPPLANPGFEEPITFEGAVF